MKRRLIYILGVLIVASACGNQNVTCPTYESDYVYVPRKAKSTNKKSSRNKKPKPKAEQ